MLTIMCILGLALAAVAIALILYLLSEYSKLEDDLDEAKLNERMVKSLMMIWKDEAQNLEKEIYGLSDNRCEECGRFLPHNHAGNLCEVCAWAKGGDL